MATQAGTRSKSKNGNGKSRATVNPRAGQRPAGEVIADDALNGGQRWVPGLAELKFGAKLALRPHRVLQRQAGLGVALARIAAGRSFLKPEKGDRRFKDPAWKHNPAFRRVMQSYLAWGEALDRLVADADLDWRSERRVRFLVENLVDALAPTNFPGTNPTVLKAAIDSGGLHFVEGVRQLVRDFSSRPLLPSSVEGSQFTLGEDLAATPGSVVLRTEVFELIEYAPKTERVREAPLLIAPQMINKFYALDLAPGKSLIEWAVGQGQHVFAMSWRNPDGRHAEWNLDTYCGAVLEALDAVEAISGSEGTHLLGPCAGGNVAAITAAHLAATGQQDRLAGLTLLVAVLDWQRAGDASAMLDNSVGALAMAGSTRKGYLSGKDLSSVFSWMRANDMIWGPWVNNYLLGQEPPAWDVLFWNADQANMPAALHRDFVQLGLENALAQPGAIEVLGTPIDLGRITVDTYAIGAIADHISPWKNVYGSARLLGSTPRFVLSTSGHIVALVNPPGNDKATYRVREDGKLPADPEAWMAGATEHEGSWWPDWTQWLGERSGSERDAPERAGAKGFAALGPAPGEYVREQI